MVAVRRVAWIYALRWQGRQYWAVHLLIGWTSPCGVSPVYRMIRLWRWGFPHNQAQKRAFSQPVRKNAPDEKLYANPRKLQEHRSVVQDVFGGLERYAQQLENFFLPLALAQEPQALFAQQPGFEGPAVLGDAQ